MKAENNWVSNSIPFCRVVVEVDQPSQLTQLLEVNCATFEPLLTEYILPVSLVLSSEGQ